MSSTNTLTKTRAVLDHCFEAEKGGIIVFEQSGNDAREIAAAFPIDLWDDMGSPEEVTVTIEPGDHLNP